MIKKVQLALFFLLCVAGVFAQTEEVLYARADSLNEAGNFEKARSLFDRLIDQNSTKDRYYSGRGNAYLGLNSIEKGEADLNKALSLNANCSNCYSNLAKIEANRGHLPEALKLLNLAIEKDENNDLAYFRRARLKEFKEDKFGALRDYNKAIVLSPDKSIYYATRGAFNMNSGYNSLAIGDFNRAVSLDTNDVFIIYERAKYFINVQDWTKALKDLSRCVLLEEENYEYYAAKGTVLEFLERHEEALEHYNISIKLDSSQYLSFLNRAISRYSLEDMDGSCADNNQALLLIAKIEANQSAIAYLNRQIDELCDQSKMSYYYQRGIAAYNLNDFNQAISYYNEGLLLFPNSPMLVSFRGNAYIELGQDAAAIADFTNFLQHKDDMVHETMANPRFEEGGPQLDLYIRISTAVIYGSLAKSYGNMENYALALSYADSAINLLLEQAEIPEMQEIRELLSSNYNIKGVIFNVLGQNENARNNFSKSIEYNNEYAIAHMNMALALINDRKALKFKNLDLRFYTVATYQSKFGMTLPLFNKRKINEENLALALIECNTAIEFDQKNAFAYLVRAQLKILLNEWNYCADILLAKELGIANAEEQLGVLCH